MRIDLRVKHDVELFDSGMGCWTASRALSVPRDTVGRRQRTYTHSEARCR